jgi:BlaI family penicillinase repressor
MPLPDISEAEWSVMETLWERAPQTASEVAKRLRKPKRWAENTVRTLLTRLAEKGALRVEENAAGVRQFSPAVEREACVRAEGESFLQRVFRGAAKPLLVHFASQTKLTPEEVRELKRLLDRSLKDNP